jgi:hypothetical protein
MSRARPVGRLGIPAKVVKERWLAVAIHKTPATQISTTQIIAIFAFEFMRSHPFFAVFASGAFSAGSTSTSFPYLIRNQQNQQESGNPGFWKRSPVRHPRANDPFEQVAADRGVSRAEE